MRTIYERHRVIHPSDSYCVFNVNMGRTQRFFAFHVNDKTRSVKLMENKGEGETSFRQIIQYHFYLLDVVWNIDSPAEIAVIEF